MCRQGPLPSRSPARSLPCPEAARQPPATVRPRRDGILGIAFRLRRRRTDGHAGRFPQEGVRDLMRRYELMLVIRPDVADDAVQAIIDRVTHSLITAARQITRSARGVAAPGITPSASPRGVRTSSSSSRAGRGCRRARAQPEHHRGGNAPPVTRVERPSKHTPTSGRRQMSWRCHEEESGPPP